MKNISAFILSFLLFNSICTSASEKTDSVTLFFRQGKAEIDSSYSLNRETLYKIESISSGSKKILSDLHIKGTASPEGSVKINDMLSQKRADNIYYLFSSSFETPVSEVEFHFTGRDWESLLEKVKDDPDVPYKEKTVNQISNIVRQIKNEGKETEENNFLESLKKLENGIPYSYLYSNIFPSLRTAKVVFNYYVIPPLSGNPDSVPFINAFPFVDPHPAIESNLIHLKANKERRNFYMALKTNMLYDLAALPSISAEFYLGKNWSAVANWTYGWWDTDRTHHYWRAYGGDLAIRWWFGKEAAEKPLTGHHIGLYGGIFTYDFEFGGTGYMGGLPHETLWNRSLKMGGVEYGYSLPIARRLNIDFTIGIGYIGGKYLKYIPDNGRYLWQSTHKINWFGPTKAEVSLVWLIGNGNYNTYRTKGGEK